MKLSLLFCLLVPAISAIVIQQPTRTVDSNIVLNKRQGLPTAIPTAHYIKRDLEDTLSLYENWANDCNDKSKDQDNNAKIAVSDLNNLWQTVTNTVYCGNGKLKTVTKTVTATKSSSTSKGSSGNKNNGSKDVKCDDKCWSTYLWRMYTYILLYVD